MMMMIMLNHYYHRLVIDFPMLMNLPYRVCLSPRNFSVVFCLSKTSGDYFCVADVVLMQFLQRNLHIYIVVQIEYDEKELRREITFAIKNINGIRYVYCLCFIFSAPCILYTGEITSGIGLTNHRPSVL